MNDERDARGDDDACPDCWDALKDAEKELTLAAAHLLRFGHATAHDAVAEGRDRARAALAEFARSATGEQTKQKK